MLPRAQGRGCALGRTGTWLELEFYCVPARAWHSPAIDIGRTGKRAGREKKDEEEGKEESEEEELGEKEWRDLGSAV